MNEKHSNISKKWVRYCFPFGLCLVFQSPVFFFVGSNMQKWHLGDPPVLRFHINRNALSNDSASAGMKDQQIEALVRAADRWHNEGGANFRFEYAGNTNNVGYQHPIHNAEDPNTWRNLHKTIFFEDVATSDCAGYWAAVCAYGNRCNSMGTLPGSPVLPTGEVLHFDICFNDDNHVWNHDITSGGGGIDIEAVAVHEFGHALKLGHPEPGVTISGPCCNPTLSTCTLTANIKPTMCQGRRFGHTSVADNFAEKRTLAPDDIIGIHTLYPWLPEPPRQLGSVRINLGGPLSDGDEDEESDWLKQSFSPVEQQGDPNVHLTLHFEVSAQGNISFDFLGNISAVFQNARSPMELEVGFGETIEIAVQLDADDFSDDCFRYRVRRNGRVIYQQEFTLSNALISFENVAAVRMRAFGHFTLLNRRSVQINAGGLLSDGDEDREADWFKSLLRPVANVRLTFSFQVIDQGNPSRGFYDVDSLELDAAFGDEIEIAVQLDEDNFSDDCFRYRVRRNGRVIYQREFDLSDALISFANVAAVRIFTEGL